MNFRTVSDLFACVRRNSHRFPRDVDLVVGVPRSGLLAACAVSLAIHKPLTDLHSFLDGRAYSGFSQRRGANGQQVPADYQSVLVVDDSIYDGNSMRKARDAVVSIGKNHRTTFAAVYGLSSCHPEADIVLEPCPAPRAFEWNIMNHPALGFSCVDLDGVLCVDPTDDENDDGPKYWEFVRSAKLLNAPRYKIDSIVTSRLEKYRSETEQCLHKNGIEYGALFMLDLPSAEERVKLRMHGKFKGRVFKERRNCVLFIESEQHQAREIRDISGKSVLAYKDMHFFPQTTGTIIQKRLRQRAGKLLPD